MKHDLGVGVIGVSQGGYAALYSQEISKIEGVGVRGVCDLGADEQYARECLGTTAGEFAASLGATLYHTVDAMLGDPGVGIVMVMSEVRDHALHAIEAIRAGKHVFIAKPVAMSAAEVESIQKEQQKQQQEQQQQQAACGKSLVVLAGEPARYEEAMVIATSRVRAGDVGRPIMARSFINHPAMTDPSWERDVTRSGGPLVEFATYCCDVVSWAVGDEPIEVFAYGGNFLHPGIDGVDNLKALVRFKGGAIGSMDMCSSITCRYPFLDLEVVGTEGVVRTDYHNYPVVTHKGEGAVLDEPRLSPMNSLEIQHFVGCILGKETPRYGLSEALRVARMVDALAESLRTGGPVRMPGQARAPVL